MDEVRTFVGNGAKLLITRALPEGVEMTDAILDRMLANYMKYQNQLAEVYEGIPELLAELKKRKPFNLHNRPSFPVRRTTQRRRCGFFYRVGSILRR